MSGRGTGKASIGSVTNPKDPEAGANRVHRGGLWSSNAQAVRSANRNPYTVVRSRPFARVPAPLPGFRLVRTG